GLEDGPKVNCQYVMIFSNILHRMRFSKFLEIVSRELDDEGCKELLEGLLQNGRLTLKQIVDRAKAPFEKGKPGRKEGKKRFPAVAWLFCLTYSHDSSLSCGVDLEEQTMGSPEGFREDVVRESFLKLLNAHFVERCPAPEPFLPAPVKAETTKKRGAKSAKINEESETIEQRVLAAAAPTEVQRFSMIINTESNVSRETSMDDSPSMIVGEKRKHDSLELDRESTAEEGEVVLWRANFEEFMRRLRHKACIENVRASLDDGAAIVLRAMLEATRSLEMKVKTEKSVPLSLDTIFEEVIKSEEGRGMTLDHVRASLVQLGCSASARGTDESYSIDLKKIIESAQNDEVESIVLQRYGRDAYKMFRLLSKNGRLVETDKISDTTFVGKKDAPKILYKLWKDEYLHMEKFVVTGARQSQFLSWKVNKPSLWEHVLDEMLHAALNLSQRVAYEWEKEIEFINPPVGNKEEGANRKVNVRFLLESSLLKLDDAIMHFHDF
ncbi:DNA-directed RNA polymerase III subunit RPC3 isoform X1, partial [Fagus crenata]